LRLSHHLEFTGGGYTGGVKLMFESEGNAWSGANFSVGSYGHDALSDGTLVKSERQSASADDHGVYRRRPARPGFGIAVDANDHAWIRERRDQREPVASNTI
jgi:hypothetical protein